MKILHLEYDQYPADALAALANLHVITKLEVDSQADLMAHLCVHSYDAIITRLGIMLSADVMQTQPALKYIITSTTGLNHIDVDAAARLGIEVISLKGESTFLASIKSTAEHTWMLLLALLRNFIPAHESVTRQQSWDRNPYLADELDGKTIGIIGFGRLGKILSTYAKAFGMNVLACDNNPIDTQQYNITPVDVNTLLQQSDIVVLMISYSENNIRYMDSLKFELMQQGSYFINTSRGEMVDEDALLKVLLSGHLKGAALDVLDGDSAWEQHYKGDPAILTYAQEHHNLLLTPHMGGYGKSSIEKTRRFVVHKFLQRIQS